MESKLYPGWSIPTFASNLYIHKFVFQCFCFPHILSMPVWEKVIRRYQSKYTSSASCPFWLQFESCIIQVSARTPTVLASFFMVFQCLQVNARTVFRNRTPPLPSTSFPIHHLLIIPPFKSLQSELLTALLIKTKINKWNITSHHYDLNIHCLEIHTLLIYYRTDS
jgi:hypothetical protein